MSNRSFQTIMGKECSQIWYCPCHGAWGEWIYFSLNIKFRKPKSSFDAILLKDPRYQLQTLDKHLFAELFHLQAVVSRIEFGSEAHSELCQTSNMERLAKIVNG